MITRSNAQAFRTRSFIINVEFLGEIRWDLNKEFLGEWMSLKNELTLIRNYLQKGIFLVNKKSSPIKRGAIHSYGDRYTHSF